jgi:hypothetical protein
MAQLLSRALCQAAPAASGAAPRRSTEEEVREILRTTVREEIGAREPLGSRLRARLVESRLDDDLPKPPRRSPTPARFKELSPVQFQSKQ